MKRFQSILCISLLTAAMASTAFGGNITTRSGNITTAPSNIAGNITTRNGNITTVALEILLSLLTIVP